MRLLFVSTHTDQITGYSRVAYHLLNEIRTLPNLELFHYGFQRHPEFRRPKLPGVIQIDAADAEDPKEQGFGFNAFKHHLESIKPDLVFIYNDTLIINRFLELIPETMRVWVYLDQVYKGTALGKIPERVERVFVFSKEWLLPEEAKLKNQTILEHGVSSTRVPAEQIEKQRSTLGLTDKTVFLNINRNSCRKRLDLTLMAFARYQRINPKAHLILVSNSEGFYDFSIIAQIEQACKEAITWIDTKKVRLTDEDINLLMNVADYGINTADGEGYGLTTLDHSNLGKPQVVLDIGAYRSFLTDTNAVFVKPTIRTYIQNQGFGLFSESAPVEDIVEAMKAVVLLPPSPGNQLLTWKEVGVQLASFFSPVLTSECPSMPSSSKTEATTSESATT